MSVHLYRLNHQLEPIIFIDPEPSGCLCWKSQPDDFTVYLTKDYKFVPYSKRHGKPHIAAEVTSQRLQDYIKTLVFGNIEEASRIADDVARSTEIDLKAYFSSPRLLMQSESINIVRALRQIYRENEPQAMLVASSPLPGV